MVNCDKCGSTLVKPTKKLENTLFCIEVYKCKKCHKTYKEAYYQTICA